MNQLNKRRSLKVSIITVAYNAVSTIDRTIRSVREQSYSNIEHIIIDGASSDGTMEIVNKYNFASDFCLSEPDFGIYDAMNKGLKMATGDIVAFLNADDYYANFNVVESVVNIFNEFNCNIVTGNILYFKKNSQKNPKRIYSFSKLSLDALSYGLMPPHPATFIRRSLMLNVGGFDPSYKIAGDFDLLVRIFLKFKPDSHHLPRVLVSMQLGGISTSGFNSKIVIFNEIRRSLIENGIAYSIFKMLIRYFVKISEFKLY